MSLDKDFLAGCVTVVLITTALIGSITYYNLSQDELVAEAIKVGASPLEAKCAYSNGIVCYTIAAKQPTQTK
jgi:hypothetical protein